MLEHSLILKLSTTGLAENTTSRLRQEYQAVQRLLQAQPASQKQFLLDQAATLAEAILHHSSPIAFSLPDRVACLPLMDCSGAVELIQPHTRPQRIGSFLDVLTHPDRVMALSHHLADLEKSSQQAVAVGASLIRYAVAMHIIYEMLPAGHPVVYRTAEDDDVPNQPVAKKGTAEPGHSSNLGVRRETDVLSKGHGATRQYSSYANSFFLPQYVAFDEQNQLLAGDVQEATMLIQTMRQYLLALNSAVCLAPYMVVDEEFQARRYGILGQLVNQGRALANYQVEMLCQNIKIRSANHTLDRGLSLSLPYFNDQTLALADYKFDIIPGGRVMFVPAFVVLAVRAEAKKILLNTELSLSTRKSLLQELCIIERTFLR
jgi:hypothetical protein